jgi:zinc finger protein 830
MADARTLLRQQRAARRINHPNATYSESGKLSCSLCHELIRSDALWDGHVRSDGHLRRLHATIAELSPGGEDHHGTGHPTKRKLVDADYEEGDHPDGNAARVKRNKAGVEDSGEESIRDKEADADAGSSAPAPNGHAKTTPSRLAPLSRRTSGTPAQGIELHIPSRPATPLDGAFATPQTPRPAASRHSPHIPEEAGGEADGLMFTATTGRSGTATLGTMLPENGPSVDESEWAAFEAEMIPGSRPGGVSSTLENYASELVISAAPMSAKQLAAKSEENERARRRAVADLQLEDDKEEAARALEDEFDEMVDLEARARRLRERREALRRRNEGGSPRQDKDQKKPGPATFQQAIDIQAVDGKAEGSSVKQDPADDEDDDGGQDFDDEWDAFRFKP